MEYPLRPTVSRRTPESLGDNAPFPDPLLSVPVETARHIFEEIINTYLLIPFHRRESVLGGVVSFVFPRLVPWNIFRVG